MTVTISKEEYFELKMAEAMLTLLQFGGVDNWDWYGDSLHPDDEATIDDIEKELRSEIFGEREGEG